LSAQDLVCEGIIGRSIGELYITPAAANLRPSPGLDSENGPADGRNAPRVTRLGWDVSAISWAGLTGAGRLTPV